MIPVLILLLCLTPFYEISKLNFLPVFLYLSLADLIVVIASIIVLGVGSNGQVFATSAIR